MNQRERERLDRHYSYYGKVRLTIRERFRRWKSKATISEPVYSTSRDEKCWVVNSVYLWRVVWVGWFLGILASAAFFCFFMAVKNYVQ